MINENFKSGFVTIIGRPNVGKSTLINALVGQKIAIISSKPQTTRNKIIAIRSTDTSQIVFIDTPGIHLPRTKLGEYMVKVANDSANDADLILFMVEVGNKPSKADIAIIEDIKKSGLPAILIINKVDMVAKEEILPQIIEYSNLFEFETVIPISARTRNGIDIVLSEIEKLLPIGPEYYPPDMVSDIQERELVAEIIREKLLRLLDKEIPHGIAIEIIEYKEKKDINNIIANIYCEKSSHKGIIIGKDGAMLKRVGSLAREELEKMLEKKVFLELWVKVKDDWRNRR